MAYFVGVDVGTGSVRAALITEFGKIVSSAVEEIKTWNVQPDFYEQSTEDIWNAVVNCIKVRERALTSSGVSHILKFYFNRKLNF